MKIYTKRGDTGKTDLYGGGRVRKNNPVIEAYGTIDELNALLGMVRSALQPDFASMADEIRVIQNNLHTECAFLASMQSDEESPALGENHVEWLEDRCDSYQEQLPQINYFILPGGTSRAALLHFARTVCRRAERKVVAAAGTFDFPEVNIMYLNRLSDLMYLMARYVNQQSGIGDEQIQYE
ncbi:MAG TPA: cob(I)yrinic acid a,c-diamide adenosyltransferase [bacterium]|nr:cob(I)yrinic acid a,c-diamide adenosyltransferase [bacterium]